MPDSDQSYELARWYESPVGEELKARIVEALPEILESLPGSQHMQMGIGGDWPLLYKHGVTIDYHELLGTENPPFILQNSQDSILLLHVLDASKDPHRILHMVDKLVARSGHIVIVGFNPYSLWGLARLPMFLSHRTPWRSGFYSLWRIRDWLKVLNFEVRLQTSLVQLPPLPGRGWFRWFKWLDRAMHWLLPHWGAVNIIVAKRPLFPMTLIKEPKKGKRLVSPVAEPTAPNSQLPRADSEL